VVKATPQAVLYLREGDLPPILLELGGSQGLSERELCIGTVMNLCLSITKF
jgi:hypothetical protein